MDLHANCWLTHNVTTIKVFEQIINEDKLYPQPMNECNKKKYVIDHY